MNSLIHRTTCPACLSNSIHPALSAIDYTVSNQTFLIWHCNACSLRFTQDVPNVEKIGPYYQSVNYVSHSDTKDGLINRLYHLVRKYTLVQKRKLVQKSTGLFAGNLLDIGAGTGAFGHTMKTSGWNVKGLEPDNAARMLAEKNYQLILDTPGTIDDLEAGSFDAITLWHVLEHVHDLEGYWNHFNRLINAKGQLIIAVPNYTSSDARYYSAHWAAYDVPRHLYHFSPGSMEQLGEKYGFELKATYPMWFDSFYVSMLSEQYKNGKPNLLNAFWQGLISNLKALFDPNRCSSVIYVFQKRSKN
jgi:SAM-dependent methyltransferase